MAETGAHKAHKKVAHSLVAVSSAAVLAVYSAGYQRTKAAADRFERLAASRRHAVPAPVLAPATPAPTTPSAPMLDAAPAAAPAATDPGRGSSIVQPASPGAASPGSASAALPSATAGATAESGPVAGSAAPAPGPAVPTSPESQQAPSVPPTEIAPISPPERGRFKDGTYQGRGSCIHGDIQAQVVVKNGRIVEATISSCETRYSCDWLDPILPQVTARQSAFVDYVSGATDSTDAFSAAVTDALLKAQ